MKKIFAFALALIMICSVAVLPAFAASGINANEQAVYDALTNGFQIGRTTVYFLNDRVGELFNYFNQDGVDMTDAQKAEVMSHINRAVALCTDKSVVAWAESGETSLAKLPYGIRETLLDCGTKACAAMGLKLVYTVAGNIVTITDAEGHVLVDTHAVVKQTADSTSMTAVIVTVIAMVSTLAAAAYVTSKKVA